ncbi:MAG: hypothetical protein GQE15_33825 [Archangiaceae bacterium]|nr:hypothetical protein [Archangiaceae bacterium]
MKSMFAVVAGLVVLVSTSSQAADAKTCGDTVVTRAKELNVLGAGGEKNARAICTDLKQADRDTFTSCAKNAATKDAIDACMRTAGRKAMGR